MFWLLVLCFVFVDAQYEVPEATVEPLSPKGFKVSIPDEEGIKLFAFHGKLNEELNGREGGTFSMDVPKAKNGRWTFYDPNTKLKPGDTLYYWTYVDYFDGTNKLGYVRDDQQFSVKELVDGSKTPVTTAPTPTKTNTPCSKTETNIKNKNFCAGDLIFNEEFSDISQFWTTEQRYADAPDYEFVMYMVHPETLQTRENVLKLKPILSEDYFGNGFVTSTEGFNFKDNCTGIVGSPTCRKNYDAGFYLPPVISSQINSKGKFSFKYGKIKIRAKLPKGDWIYPELYLNPVNEEYGSNYESGQIRIAFSPGNQNSNQVLQGGVILSASNVGRTSEIKSVRVQDKNWSDDFHTYGVSWTPDNIVLEVDDRTYGSIYSPPDGFSRIVNEPHSQRWKKGSNLAPFDKEMYFTIGVGVGGFNFEDTNDGTKPWKNGERLSVKKFYNARENWHSTWGEKCAMEVDYIKVWAV